MSSENAPHVKEQHTYVLLLVGFYIFVYFKLKVNKSSDQMFYPHLSFSFLIPPPAPAPLSFEFSLMTATPYKIMWDLVIVTILELIKLFH